MMAENEETDLKTGNCPMVTGPIKAFPNAKAKTTSATGQ